MSEGTGENSPLPVSPAAVTLANVVCYDAETGSSEEERELHQLLSSPHLSSLLAAHDRVANKEYPLQSVADAEGEGGSQAPVRVIYVEKKQDPLVSGE